MKNDFNFDSKGKRLFLFISTLTLLIMMLITTVLWWFVSPRLHEISTFLANISLTALRIFFFILLLGTVLVLITSFSGKNLLVAKLAILAYIKILYPLTVLFSSVFGISREKIRTSYVHVNNSFIRSLKKRYSPQDILLLLPHCLQNADCNIRLTFDILKCQRCGKCDLAEICRLVEKFGIKAAIATGGTLARKIVIENRPKFIIAIACDRDLVDGMREVFPVPIFGLLNERPEGPCINTRVAAEKINLALGKLLVQK